MCDFIPWPSVDLIFDLLRYFKLFDRTCHFALHHNSLHDKFSPSQLFSLTELGSYKKRCKRNEIEEMQSDVRKKHTFSKILTSKRSLDHVNKILKVKRLQRQAKTGNNVVKRRRGRPRKQTLASNEGFLPQMPVLEKCMDFPGKRNLHSNLMLTQPEFSSHDSITDAIESVVHQARAQPNPQTPQMAKPYPKYQPEEQLERPVRRGRGSRRDEPASH